LISDKDTRREAFSDTSSAQQIINSERERLKMLGFGKDILLLFGRGLWLPDWEIAETFPDAVQTIITDIYKHGQEREHALEELAVRRWPN
jgi:hypothetical protein